MQLQLDRCKAVVSDILISAGDARGEGTVRTTMSAFLGETIREWQGIRSPADFECTNAIEVDAEIISDTALKQVIFNILDNALEASPGWIGVVAESRGEDIVLTVKDAGPGFPDEMLAELGKPYRSTKNRPGSGLGLFLVVNVIRKLGGGINALNNPDGGASVTLTLPLEALAAGDGHGG